MVYTSHFHRPFSEIFTLPKTVPAGLLGRAARCMAVKVVRRDGVTFGLTDTNVPFVYQGVTYSPIGGVSATTVESDAGTTAGSLSFRTLEHVADAVGTTITAEDLRGGRYKGAQAWVYELDPTAPQLGAIVHNRYLFSTATIRDAEKEIGLLELLDRLRTPTGRTIQPGCDVGCVWNRRCDPSQTLKALYSFSRTVASVAGDFTLVFAGDAHPDDYYSKGYLTWTSGPNAGLLDEIKVHRLSGGAARITLATPPGFLVSPGDVAVLTRGCGRGKEDCKAIPNALNPSGTQVENFQGFGASANGKGGVPLPDDANRVGRQPKT